MSEVRALDLLKRGIASAREGDKTLAKQLLLRSAELNANNDAVWLWLAVTATSDGEKVGYLERALALKPENERLQATLTQLKSKLSHQEPAWRCPLCMTPAGRPQAQCVNCRAVLTLADLQAIFESDAHQGKLERAIFGYKNVLGQGVDFGAHFNLGIAHLNLGQMDAGIAHLQQALRLEPRDKELQYKIDELIRRQGEGSKNGHNGYKNGHSNGHGVVEEEETWVRGTILAVDDSPTIRKLVSMTLRRHDYEVILAEDGMEALGKLNHISPDLILLDITMPRMNGYQVCKIIKGNRATKAIPVIMLSGKDGFFDKVRGRLAGSSVYVTKPFDPRVLLQIVEEHALLPEEDEYEEYEEYD